MTECVKIKCDDCKFVEGCVDYGWDGCRKFTPKPSKEQTNEEWFDTLSTEEKAEVLYKFYCDGRNDELQVYVSINANSFKEWLKQPHV